MRGRFEVLDSASGEIIAIIDGWTDAIMWAYAYYGIDSSYDLDRVCLIRVHLNGQEPFKTLSPPRLPRPRVAHHVPTCDYVGDPNAMPFQQGATWFGWAAVALTLAVTVVGLVR